MRITTTETETGTGTQNSSHRRRKGSSVRGPYTGVHRPGATHPIASVPTATMRISSKETEIPGGHGRPKRSSSTSSLEDAHASNPAWVILNRFGARRDSFDGDRTTSAVSYTSGGKEMSVSFELAMPPETSLLTLDWPQGPRPSEGTTSYPYVVAAHGNVVLLEIISTAKYPRPTAIDYFVYKAKASGEPSLTRLPVCYWKGASNRDNPRPRIMSRVAMGILSCSKDSFVVAEMERRSYQHSAANIYLFCSGSEDWRVFRDVPIDHSHGVGWWSTDAVLSYRRRYLIWVDYLRGMIVAEVAHPGGDPQEPALWYVPLPVDPVLGNPYDSDRGRGCPEASRNVCATHHGIKFVNVNQCGGSFSITLWSWCEDETWRKDAALDAAQLWGLDCENRLPNVRPEFPVVDMENPYTVCFLLNEGHHIDPEATTWMIKVHMKKKILLDCTGYSNNGSSSHQNTTYMTARRMSERLSFISSEMPYYLPEQTMKRNVKTCT
uniref:DUF1618 domain-containing protein n=1 Tax=Oryza punctata TaxID=4537 RepID=A0A0E0JER5_ORYPU